MADGTRTHDDRNHNPGLYQLSYSHRRGHQRSADRRKTRLYKQIFEMASIPHKKF
ncbi:hypothetical protein CBM2637_A170308 [Cupriavidus taiwanensis]|nr:hypothetical protein CBM2637_A170308 [Cupriavidus taiwanensis]SPA50078.1 protein of unknown function [Cupriavidus taiwanensis]